MHRLIESVCLFVQDYQVDWEAILARSPTPFIPSVSPWLYPPAAKETPLHGPSGQGLRADSIRADVELPGVSAPPGGTSSDEEADISIQNGDVQGVLTSKPRLSIVMKEQK